MNESDKHMKGFLEQAMARKGFWELQIHLKMLIFIIFLTIFLNEFFFVLLCHAYYCIQHHLSHDSNSRIEFIYLWVIPWVSCFQVITFNFLSSWQATARIWSPTRFWGCWNLRKALKCFGLINEIVSTLVKIKHFFFLFLNLCFYLLF